MKAFRNPFGWGKNKRSHILSEIGETISESAANHVSTYQRWFELAESAYPSSEDHEKITNAHHDFLHKLCTKLISNQHGRFASEERGEES
jgi:hypothetical protein